MRQQAFSKSPSHIENFVFKVRLRLEKVQMHVVQLGSQQLLPA